MIRALVFFTLFVCIFPRQALAQSFEAPIHSFTAEPNYRKLARDAIHKQPQAFHFNMFRAYYSQTTFYDPVGKETLDRIMALAFIVDTKPDTPEAEKALSDYRALVDAHLANIDVVEQAISLASQNEAFGDLKMLHWMRRGLINNVTLAGDGKSLNTAYRVVTLGEEAIVLKSLGVEILETKAEHSGRLYYNMHKVFDPKRDAEYTVFVDVTSPMKYIAWKEKDKAHRTFVIPRQ